MTDNETAEGPVHPPPPRRAPPPAAGPRLTVVTKVYHQVPGVDIDGPVIPSFALLLESDEEAYNRRVAVGEDWQEIDFGWIKPHDCALVHLCNAIVRPRSVIPTADELLEFRSHVLEVGKVIAAATDPDGRTPSQNEHVEPLFTLAVGQDVALSLVDGDRFRIRCRNGQGRYAVFAVPG